MKTEPKFSGRLVLVVLAAALLLLWVTSSCVLRWGARDGVSLEPHGSVDYHHTEAGISNAPGP